jgi:L-aminopeptidase/D-esterase-like protein
MVRERLRTITDVRGVRVGHAQDAQNKSGVTAILFERAAPTVVDVRGGASCTYDTASLSPEATFGRRWAVFFSGGSVYGLDAARGVRARILETGGGHSVFHNPFPVVPISGATIFDLPSRFGPLPDYLPLGYDAARVASTDEVPAGRVGAGSGALVGKYLGRKRAMSGGEGSASVRWSSTTRLGALAVVNAVGAIRDPESARWVAGARDARRRVVSPGEATRAQRPALYRERGTTLVVVATDLALTRPQLQRLAIMAHTGLGRVVYPTHTATDGDVVFVTSTAPRAPKGPVDIPLLDRLGQATAELVTHAVLRAVDPTQNG